jgi:hypothetical protein
VLSRELAGAPNAGTFLTIGDDSSLQFAREDFAYVVVANWHNSNTPANQYAGYGRIVSKQSLVPPFRGVVLLANYPTINVGGPTATRFVTQLDVEGDAVFSSWSNLNDDAVRVYASRRVGGVVAARIDGQTVGEFHMSPSDVSEPGAPVMIGGSTGEGLDGNIAEVVVLHGATSVAGLAALERHLMSKYGVTTGVALK